MNFLASLLATSYHIVILWMALALHPVAAVQPGLGEGFWHTRGSQLLDSGNRNVRIAGINWYGFETADAVPGGLQQQDYRTIIQTIKRSGYNTIRIPLSNQMVETPMIPKAIQFTNHAGPINTDLQGLNSLQILDKIIAYAGQQGLKVILDNHRSEAGDGTELSGLWFTQAYPESAWMADWQMLAQRYINDPAVLGMDLRNEPHNANSSGACWGCGGPNDWRFAAERAGNAVLAINPKLLIFVEGVDAYEDDFYWWGGNLMGVRNNPVRLKVANQLVYSAHAYGPSEAGQPWFKPDMSDESLEAVWVKHWAYISRENIAPVWLGEFGIDLKSSEDPTSTPTAPEAMESKWFQSLVKYLAKDSRVSWTYWALNGNDRYGILNSNYDNIRGSNRQDLLASIQNPLGIGLKAGHGAPAEAQTIIEPVAHTASLQPVPVAQAQPASLVPVPALIPRGEIHCQVTYTNSTDWQKGYSAALLIRNTGTTPIHGWQLSFSFDGNQRIEQLWNARYTQDGQQLTVINEAWNSAIPAGGELTGVGFNAAYSGQNRRPTQFYLNGTLCK